MFTTRITSITRQQMINRRLERLNPIFKKGGVRSVSGLRRSRDVKNVRDVDLFAGSAETVSVCCRGIGRFTCK